MLYQIEITTHCNFQCFYCAGRDMPQRHMEWDLFASLLGGIPDGTHLVSLQGEGEPTTHPRFWDMVAAVKGRGLTPYTITNGSHIDVEQFAEAFPRVAVSIDTLDPDEAERIGRYKLARVLANLEALAARMGPGRIHIMSVDYGQSLAEVYEFARTRGFSHGVQALQPKADYARRYRELLDAPAPQYTLRCRFLEQPLRRYYDIKGREYPCCYIKDARWHEPVAAMQAKMQQGVLPAACKGCAEILTPESRPQPKSRVPIAGNSPRISIVTTCKGRLAHLRESLALLAGHAGTEMVVVDYDCPDQSGMWVAQHFPGVRVVTVRDAPVFSPARARNLGAAAARGEWLAFIDADSVLDARFVAHVLPLLRKGAFYTVDNENPNTWGLTLCSREDFAAIEGYDETIEGWGSEDRDFCIRLALLGRSEQKLPGEWVRVITHSDEVRVRYYEIKDLWFTQRVNALYVQIKHDLARQLGKVVLPSDVRRAMYAEVRRVLLSAASNPHTAARVDVTLPPELAVRLTEGYRLKRVWTYLLEPPAQPGAAPGAVADGVANPVVTT